MSKLEALHTDAAPQAIGPYSQAIRAGDTVWLSGQIPLDPQTMEVQAQDIEGQTRQVFDNLVAVAAAAGGTLSDVVKINISLVDLSQFAQVNAIMAEYCSEPYPARACVQVAALPRDVLVEIEAIMVV
jgi:reactive intermediate/imine deaminase